MKIPVSAVIAIAAGAFVAGRTKVVPTVTSTFDRDDKKVTVNVAKDE